MAKSNKILPMLGTLAPAVFAAGAFPRPSATLRSTVAPAVHFCHNPLMAKSKRPPQRGPVFPRQLKSLLTALQGARFTSAITQPQVMLSSLTSIRTFPKAKATKAGLAVPLTARIGTCCREMEKTGCDKRAQIVGYYDNFLAAGEKPIGEAAVTALLNLAASQRCADELECPAECPASFTEQKKLYEYLVGKTFEWGLLTTAKTQWNCRCQHPIEA